MCKYCKIFGHTEQQCRRLQQNPQVEQAKKEWKPVKGKEQIAKPVPEGEKLDQNVILKHKLYKNNLSHQ